MADSKKDPRLVELTIDRVAHGGHCVARDEDRVVFVRHTLPGEVVRARITGEGPKGRYLTADAVEILQPAPGRVEPPCRHAGPEGCGGCDFQHADLVTQRSLKTAVVREQLDRMAGVAWDGEVMAVPGDNDGLAWRTRVQFAVDERGRAGFRKFHSHDVVPVDRCLIATAGVNDAECDGVRIDEGEWSVSRLTVADPYGHGPGVIAECPDAPVELEEYAADRKWRVPVNGFWQVHSGAADALADRVVAAVGDAASVWDLYGGVGLFAGAIIQAGRRKQVDLVESDRQATACARKNLADQPTVRVHRKAVKPWLERAAELGASVDCVVLDPPRKGAGRAVLDLIDDADPSRIVYVACDPAALGRDTKILLDLGFRLTSLEALDLFPMTHHVECVAVFDRSSQP